MKSFLTIISGALLLMAAIFVLQTESEAVPQPLPQNLQCDSALNPWVEGSSNPTPLATLPQGPFVCPQGQSHNPQCADAVEDNWEVCAEAARIAASVNWTQACMLAESLLQSNNKLYNNGYLTHAEWQQNASNIISTFGQSAQDAQDGYWDAIQDCNDSYEEMLEECCEGD